MRIPLAALLLLLSTLACDAIPLNITTYNYITYDISRFLYIDENSLSSALNSLCGEDVGRARLRLSTANSYFDDERSPHIYTKPALLLSDFKTTKLNHDYNNVVYCLVKYLKRLNGNNPTKLLKLDRDLINFVNINKSTDTFLKKMIRRSDVKKILQSFKLLKEANSERLVQEEVIRSMFGEDSLIGVLPHRRQYQSDYIGFNFEQGLKPQNANFLSYSAHQCDNQTVNINFVHLYHLIPNVNDTFQYQVFHNLKFAYPSLDNSIKNSMNFLSHENSIFKMLYNVLSELTSKDIQISFSSKKQLGVTTTFSNIKVMREWSVGNSLVNSLVSGLKFQLNVFILINVGILGVKLLEFVTGNHLLFSFQRLVFYV